MLVKRVVVVGIILALVLGGTSCGGSKSGGGGQSPYSGDDSLSDEPGKPLPSDTTPPSISGVSTAQVTQTEATITWTTDEEATGLIEYGLSTAYGFSSSPSSSLVTAHSMSITSLSPRTTYHYRLVATDGSGNEAVSRDYTFTTLNPSVRVTLDKIGVYDDHDPIPLVQGPGEIYVYLAIGDGKSEPQAIRIPSTGDIQLNNNETKAIGQQVFFSDCVGDELKIVAVAFEGDPAIAGLAKEVLTGALLAYLDPATGGMASLVYTLLSSVPLSGEGSPEGVEGESVEDDFVGAIEMTWTADEGWGVGSHTDVSGGDLRLWFTIASTE